MTTRVRKIRQGWDGMKKDRLSKRIAKMNHTMAPSFSPGPSRSAKSKDRDGERAASYRIARLRLGAGEDLRCVIKNMSRNGAKIVLEGKIALPRTVILDIDAKEMSCAVRWQNENEAGLKFNRDSKT